MTSTGTEPLTQKTFNQALAVLGDSDPDLGGVLETFGPPPMWAREPGFPTLVNIILEQQVSLASAKAAFDRLRLAVPTLTPSEFLKLDDATLKNIGFSWFVSIITRLGWSLSVALTYALTSSNGVRSTRSPDGSRRWAWR